MFAFVPCYGAGRSTPLLFWQQPGYLPGFTGVGSYFYLVLLRGLHIVVHGCRWSVGLLFLLVRLLGHRLPSMVSMWASLGLTLKIGPHVGMA